MKKISQDRLKTIAREGGSKVSFEPRATERSSGEDGFSKALQGVEAAVKVIRASSELHFARADRIDSLVEKLSEKLESTDQQKPPAPYRIRVTKRDKNGNIVELNAIPGTTN